MQTLLFWLKHKLSDTKWNSSHVIYLLSSMASLAGIIKAIYVYNLRYEVVVRGFEKDRKSIDDEALALQLLKERKYIKLNKVLSRMELHGKNINKWNKE